jgi:hypothetical protein
MMSSRDVTADGKAILLVGFYTPEAELIPTSREPPSLYKRIVNGSVSCCTRRGKYNFSHAELCFSDRSVTSINQTFGKVHYRKSTLSNPGYSRFLKLYIDTKKEDKMKELAHDFATRGIPFNQGGMWWNFIPCLRCCPLRREGRAVFCSEYIIMLFQSVGLLTHLDASTTSPTDLFLALKYEMGEARARPTYNELREKKKLPPAIPLAKRK